MNLSSRDAFRPCSRDSSSDKSQFCFNSQKQILIVFGPLYCFQAIPVFQCNMATTKLFAYNLPTNVSSELVAYWIMVAGKL